MTIVDIYDDNTRVLYNLITEQYVVPDFAKTASFGIGEAGRAFKKVFAEPRLTKFAMDTPADVWWSNAFFSKTADELSESQQFIVSNSLAERAAIFNIDIDLTPVKAASVTCIPEIPLDKFALSLPVEAFSDAFMSKYASYEYCNHIALYPLDNAKNIKIANTLFPKSLDGDLGIFRGMVAEKIASAMEEFKIDPQISPEVLRYTTPVTEHDVVTAFQERIRLSPESAEKYGSILQEFSEDRDITKLAMTTSLLDKETGADRYYASAYPDPFRYMAGVDFVEPEHIPSAEEIADAKFEDIKLNKSAALEKVFGAVVKEKLASRKIFEQYLSELPTHVRNFAEGLIN